MSKRDISHLSELDAPTANADVYGAAIGTGAPIKKRTKNEPTKKDIYVQCCLELCKKIQEGMKGPSSEKTRKDYEEHDGEQYDNMLQKMKTKMEIYNDPIHGSIQLNPLETAIVNTPEFYRLKEIKQLGGVSHVYPGAIHTRFEHSIGVCHLAGRMIKHLRERSGSEIEITDEEEFCVRLVGLCHDLGHGPFSHLFEEVVKEICPNWKDKHETISTKLFKRIILENPKVTMIFVKCGLEHEHVEIICNMILGNKEKPKGKEFLYEIVANKESGIDVDKWDYFARDCHHLGLKNEFDMERCLALSSIVKCGEERHVGFRDKEKTNIYGMFRTRCILHQKAYNHSTGNGVEMMIRDVLCKGKDIEFQQDISLNSILEKATDDDYSQYILLTDSILSTLMLVSQTTEPAKSLIQRIQRRDIYKHIGYKCYGNDELDIFKGLHDKKQRKELKENFCKHFEKKKFEWTDDEGKVITDFEIKVVFIKYASEESEDPVADNVYFFDKKHGEKPIPEIKQNGENSTSEVKKRESKVNTPKAFVEYRICLYFKTTREDDTYDIVQKFKSNIMASFEQKVEEDLKILGLKTLN